MRLTLAVLGLCLPPSIAAALQAPLGPQEEPAQPVESAPQGSDPSAPNDLEPETHHESRRPTEGGWIEVRSLDRTGRVLASAKCHYALISHFGVPVQPQTTPAQEEGFTRFGPLRPSTYRIQREARSHDRQAHVVLFEDVTVVAGEVQRVTLNEITTSHDQLKTRCMGTVYLDGSPVQGAGLTLSDELGVVARAVTNRRGRYDLAVAKTGRLWLKAAHAQADSAAAEEVEVRPKQSTWVSLRLSSQGSDAPRRSGDGFAGSLQSAGDLDADGADDLLIDDHNLLTMDWLHMSCVAVSGATGRTLFEVPSSRFRRSCQGVGGVGDVNVDGTPDFVTLFQENPSSVSPGEQGLQLHSGADGWVLLEHVLEPRHGKSQLPASAQIVNDQNGDGIGDVALARRERIDGETKLTSVEILSGADLRVLQRFEVNFFEYVWLRWCLPGDLDLDGAQDLVVRGRRPLDHHPSLIALSGSTQRPIPGWEDRMKRHRMLDFVPAGDLNGDGAGDLFMTHSEWSRESDQSATRLVAVSGLTGEVLAQHVHTLAAMGGFLPVPLPDVDGDGVGDVLLASHGSKKLVGRSATVSVHSGVDLRVIHTLKTHSRQFTMFHHFSIHGCSLTDVNGDRVPDIAVGATSPYFTNSHAECPGTVEVFSGKDGQSLTVITKDSIRAR